MLKGHKIRQVKICRRLENFKDILDFLPTCTVSQSDADEIVKVLSNNIINCIAICGTDNAAILHLLPSCSAQQLFNVVQKSMGIISDVLDNNDKTAISMSNELQYTVPMLLETLSLITANSYPMEILWTEIIYLTHKLINRLDAEFQHIENSPSEGDVEDRKAEIRNLFILFSRVLLLDAVSYKNIQSNALDRFGSKLKSITDSICPEYFNLKMDIIFETLLNGIATLYDSSNSNDFASKLCTEIIAILVEPPLMQKILTQMGNGLFVRNILHMLLKYRKVDKVKETILKVWEGASRVNASALAPAISEAQCWSSSILKDLVQLYSNSDKDAKLVIIDKILELTCEPISPKTWFTTGSFKIPARLAKDSSLVSDNAKDDQNLIYLDQGFTISTWVRRHKNCDDSKSSALSIAFFHFHIQIRICEDLKAQAIVYCANKKFHSVSMERDIPSTTWVYTSISVIANEGRLQITVGFNKTTTDIKLHKQEYDEIRFDSLLKAKVTLLDCAPLHIFRGVNSQSCHSQLLSFGPSVLFELVPSKPTSRRRNSISEDESDEVIENNIVFSFVPKKGRGVVVNRVSPSRSPTSYQPLEDEVATGCLSQNVQDAWDEIGGLKAVFFMYAKALNDDLPREIQGKLLKLIMYKLQEKSHEIAIHEDFVNMLAFLLTSLKASIDEPIMNILLGTTKKFHDKSPYEKIMKQKKLTPNVKLLAALAKDWNIWEHRPLAFVKFIEDFKIIIAKGKKTDFMNMEREIITELLQTIHELADVCGPEWAEVNGWDLAKTLRSLIVLLIEKSADEETSQLAILQMWNALLLMHPACDTYVYKDTLGHTDWINLEDPLSDFNENGAANLFEQRPTFLSENESDEKSEMTLRRILTEEESFSTEDEYVEKQDTDHKSWIIAVRTELLDYLCEVIQNAPDTFVESITSEQISADGLIVMITNQLDERLRGAIVRLLSILLIRATETERIVFVKSQQCRILASQLKGCPADANIIDAVFSIVFRETISFKMGMNADLIRKFEPDRISCDAIDLAFIVFEESTHDPTMFPEICSTLRKMFEHNGRLRQAMIDHQLSEVLVNVLNRIANQVKRMTRAMVWSSISIWTAFAAEVVRFGIPMGDSKAYITADRLIKLVAVLDVQENSYKPLMYKKMQKIVRQSLCSLLLTALQSIKDIVDHEATEHKSASGSSTVVGSGQATPYGSCCNETVDGFEVIDHEHLTGRRMFGGFNKFKEWVLEKTSGKKKDLECPYSASGPLRNVSTEEMVKRIRNILTMCEYLFCIMPPFENPVECENTLFNAYVDLLSKVQQSDEPTVLGFYEVQEEARKCFARLASFVIFDAARKWNSASNDNAPIDLTSPLFVERKKRVLQHLSSGSQGLQLVNLMAIQLDYQGCLRLGLFESRTYGDDEYKKYVDALLNVMKWDKSTNSLSPDEIQAVESEYQLTLMLCDFYRKSCISSLKNVVYAVLFDMKKDNEKFEVKTVEYGHALTREAVRKQGNARKIAFSNTRRMLLSYSLMHDKLDVISKSVFHPCSYMFEKKHWPSHRVLCSTEGPHRERIRTVPAPIDIQPKFFKESARGQFEGFPLQKLVESLREGGSEVSIKESGLACFDSFLLHNGTQTTGQIVLSELKIYFISGETKLKALLEINYDAVTEIHPRRFELNDVAVELVLKHDSYLLVFKSDKDRAQGLEILSSRVKIITDKKQIIERLHEIHGIWRSGKMTNFEYLIRLNTLAGRTYNDLMQYPVMPFVLSDYRSNILDLKEPSSYRNLAKPIAIQNPKMEEHYRSMYVARGELAKSAEMMAQPSYAAHHYGSHYSNLGTVTHFLVRVSPFTEHALDFQDHSFDIPDRLFNSIEASYRLSSNESTTDFKEIVPELFVLPECLTNELQLDLGKRQNGESVENVKLPAWAENPRIFIYAHRQALESSYVTDHLHQWIDLIFGYKQSGQQAIDAINVFHPATYVNQSDLDKFDNDLVSKQAHQAMIRTYGQMPAQLFQNPHQSIMNTKPLPTNNDMLYNVDVDGWRIGPQFLVTTTFDPVLEQSLILDFTADLKVDALNYTKYVDVFIVKKGTYLCEHSSLKSRQFSKMCYFKGWMFQNLQNVDKAIMKVQDVDKVKNVVISADVSQLAIVYNSMIQLHSIRFDHQHQVSFSFEGCLYHFSEIAKFEFCPNFSVAVSIGEDGQFIVWDTVKKCYSAHNKVESKGTVVSLHVDFHTAEVSIVVTNEIENCSFIELYSINGKFISSIRIDAIVVHSTMNSHDPGVGVSCIACATRCGSIRIFEVITLSLIAEFRPQHIDVITEIKYVGPNRLAIHSATGHLQIWKNKEDTSSLRIEKNK